MRYGVTFSHPDLGDDPGFFKEFAQSVEGAGFDHLVAAEHVIGGHPDRLTGEKVHTYDVRYHEPFVLFGYLGAVTERIELVTGILILPQRQTVLVAKQCAELDLLTGGRLVLGVGVGRNWMEYEALNEDFTQPRRSARGADRGAATPLDRGARHLRRRVAPPRSHGPQPDARAAADPDLDGRMVRQDRREGAATHGTHGRWMDAAVPAGAGARRRDRATADIRDGRRPRPRLDQHRVRDPRPT